MTRLPSLSQTTPTVLAVVSMLGVACRDVESSTRNETTVTSDGGDASEQPEPIPVPSASSEDAGPACPTPSVVVPESVPVPPTVPFVSNPSFPDCVHPGVNRDCENGWCRIPAGCFIWGSPEWEPGRGLNSEEQGSVTLTHDFEIGQFEVTIAEWEALGFEFNARPNGFECEEEKCPVGGVSWFEMIAFANALSESHEPPLEPCYAVENCGPTDTGYSYSCERFELRAETAYECEGYRLPTRAEWQYAARAGTTTSFYSGNITVTDELQQLGCYEEPNLEPIAWYAANAERKVHPVGQKLPNAWGLHDVLGNVSESLHDRHTGQSPVSPAEDPFGELGLVIHSRPVVGSDVIGWPSLLRIGAGLEGRPYLPTTGEGFRLARTLGVGALPTGDDVSTASAGSGAAPAVP